jgi:hypothetical protein
MAKRRAAAAPARGPWLARRLAQYLRRTGQRARVLRCRAAAPGQWFYVVRMVA